MTFLLAFWKPIAAILAVLAVVATVGIMKHRYDERRRDEGRTEIQVKWDAAKVAQHAREVVAAKEADEFQTRAYAKRDADFNALARRNAVLAARLAAIPVGPDLAASLRDTIRTSNGESPGEPAKGAAPVAAATSELDVAEWGAKVGEQYRACREQVIGWIKWDDRRAAQ